MPGLQEAGLEQQKKAASSLLQKAKVAEATVAEGERKAEATRSVNCNFRHQKYSCTMSNTRPHAFHCYMIS